MTEHDEAVKRQWWRDVTFRTPLNQRKTRDPEVTRSSYSYQHGPIASGPLTTEELAQTEDD